jgi:hypothetical protein
VEARRQRTDASALHGAAQRRQRKPRAAVFHRRVLAVDRHVRDAQVVVDRRLARIDGVELRGAVVRRAGPLRALVRLVGRRRGDQRGRALRQRLGQRRERHVIEMRPAVRIAVTEREVPVTRALQVRDRRVLVGRETEVHVRVGIHRAIVMQLAFTPHSVERRG